METPHNNSSNSIHLDSLLPSPARSQGVYTPPWRLSTARPLIKEDLRGFSRELQCQSKLQLSEHVCSPSKDMHDGTAAKCDSHGKLIRNMRCMAEASL